MRVWAAVLVAALAAVPAAVFAAPGEDSSIKAAPDFAPSPSAPAFAKSGRVGADWVLIVPAILAGLIVFTPLLVLTLHRGRDRRAVRQHSSARGRV
jgi:hypothetical protein